MDCISAGPDGTIGLTIVQLTELFQKFPSLTFAPPHPFSRFLPRKLFGMTKAAAVILNYNGRHFLERFLPDVIKYTPSAVEVIVADNASTDDSVAWLKERFPAIRIIHNKKNFGFAGGYNEALKQVKADIYILLNSDLAVTENYAEPILEALQSDPNLAAAQPKVLWHTEPQKFDYAGAAGGFIDKYGYPFCRGRLFQSLETDTGQYNDTREVFWASGACLFIKAADFWKMGGFDADFFAHMEEIDLCWRLKNTGAKIACVPASVVYHMGGGTLGSEKPHKAFLNFRNSLFTLFKNQRKNLFGIMFLRMSLDGMALFHFLLKGQVSHVAAILKAHTQFYLSLPKLIKKRTALLKKAGRSNNCGYYKGSIAAAYFLKKKKTFSQLEPSDFD